MSYDLYFYRRGKPSLFRRGDPPLTAQELRAWSGQYPHFRPNGPEASIMQLVYENPDTGADFRLDFSGSASGASNKPVAGKAFLDVGLAFNMNYARPSFYALEAMPIIADMATRLSLLTLNPQDYQAGDPPPAPKPTDVNRLIATWTNANAQVLKLFGQAQNLPTMPAAASHAWWRYMFHKQALEKRLGGTVFVPGIFLLAPRAGGAMRTSVTWAPGNAMVFPPTDLIAVIKADGIGYVAAEHALGALAPYLEDLPHADVPGLRILRPEHEAEAMAIYETLPIAEPADRYAMTRGNDILFNDAA
jgi:hypothetical protein